MPENLLTDLKVRSAKSTDRDWKLSDGGGLFLLVKPTGGKLWLPAFQRYRELYMDDTALRRVQQHLIRRPTAGDLILGIGGLRKCCCEDSWRGKGKRGGLRVIYYWWQAESQFWLFTLYDKDEINDLSVRQRKMLADMLRFEFRVRKS